MSEIRCMVVTPEQTELDVRSNSVTVPLFDGELGILPGHSPLVGRLGYGILRIGTGTNTDEYFVEGGFVQVADGTVSILTDKVAARSTLTSAIANEAMSKATQMPMSQPEEKALREKAILRAQALQRVTA